MAKIPEPQRRHLASSLEAAGWSLLPGDKRMSGWVARGGERYPIVFRQAPDARRSVLEALLSVAILRGRSAVGGGEFVAMVGAPSVSPAMARALDGFIAEVAPNQPYGYVDDRGLVRFHGLGLEGARGEPVRRAARRAVARPPDLFSDLNQWLLKVLIGREFPAGLIAVPRAPIQTAADLAEWGHVSTSAAWRLQRALRDGGYLDDAGNLALVSELFGRWRSALGRPQQRVGAKWIFPGRNPLDRLRGALADERARAKGPSACLGLFAACDEHGLGHVRGAPFHVYVRHLELELLERLGLMLAAEGQQPDLILQVAQWPEAVFRAVVYPKGVPAADVLQCWLDVSHEPSRGAEQARLIWRRVIGPTLNADEPPA